MAHTGDKHPYQYYRMRKLIEEAGDIELACQGMGPENLPM